MAFKRVSLSDITKRIQPRRGPNRDIGVARDRLNRGVHPPTFAETVRMMENLDKIDFPDMEGQRN